MRDGMRFAIIGGGNMGSAFAKGLAKSGVEIVSTRRGGDNLAAVAGADVVILAVKPQIAGEILAELRGSVDGKLCISVMAGVSLERLQSGLGTKRVVRTMPNLAAKVGRAVTVWTAPSCMTRADRRVVRSILSSVGHVVFVRNEGMVNPATAACGSGLAYFFWMEELLIQFLTGKGFCKAEARQMAGETLGGAADYRRSAKEHPRTSRRRVTSKRGTTNAGFRKLYRGRVGKKIKESLDAACRRSRELGK